MTEPQTLAPNPFVNLTDKPLVAIKGARNGYLQLAASTETPDYSQVPDALLFAARAWAQQLETLGSPRVYWVTLSEVVTHLHIHLYPRWAEDTLKGVTLFEQRETHPQPGWTPAVNEALATWAAEFEVHLVEPGGSV